MDFCTKYYLKREPPLAQSSITNYCGLIRNLYKKLNMEFDDIKDLSVVADADKVFKIQETMGSFLSKRNQLNAILVLLFREPELYTEAIKRYTEKRDMYNEQYISEQNTHVKSDKQMKNWATVQELRSIVPRLREAGKYKGQPTNEELWSTMMAFVVDFMTIIPLRNEMSTATLITKRNYNLLTDEDVKKSNYLVLGKEAFFSFAQYKTSKTYGVRKVKVPVQCYKTLNKWIKIRLIYFVGSALLYKIPVVAKNKIFVPMNNIDFTIALKKVFGKYLGGRQISSNLLRHIVVSENLGKAAEIANQLSTDMGHSRQTQENIYIKKIS